ncbi:MAG: SsrA-binding protein SmpB [Acidimicrobiales bacterium]|jgi:SsrA-binding protein|nr:SsrA-binding protein SmpB [Acidimicrobiales bacterium]MDP6297995.1 SsrA-binding protein SmpB [Acidimicrobiales bacterium]HJM28448.1 SsrA-binding protein SmpB [Acidimicrobiales bacterium]HJM96977.1 SsrA-binding protein SmpB [Acidimicrobiales bacterium]
MKTGGKKIVATNRQARREFEIFDSVEAGMVLVGSEVKSLRNAQAQIAEAYCRIHDGEIWLNSCHISRYDHASPAFSHEPDRPKKLLLHKKEIFKLQAQIDQKGLALIPLALYFKNGRAKVELGLARRKNLVDKRRTIAQREADREAARAIAKQNKQGNAVID